MWSWLLVDYIDRRMISVQNNLLNKFWIGYEEKYVSE